MGEVWTVVLFFLGIGLVLFAGVRVGRTLLGRLAPRLAAVETPADTAVPAQLAAIVDRDVPLARDLTPEERQRLLGLTARFVREKRFEGCAGLTVTDEMRTVVGAQACLLILHITGYFYPRLSQILVYPSAFIPREATWVKGAAPQRPPHAVLGESWPDGAVVLAWDSAQTGGRDPADGSNVVLHEFAHQLDQEDGRSDGVPPLDTPGARRRWEAVLTAHLARLREDLEAGRETVLNPYAAEDAAEFFAVATECFFERGGALRKAHPELYDLLRQFYG